MATDVILPKMGFTMTEGMIQEWVSNDGDQVTEGQLLFVLEAEKTAVDVEAPASGTLRILVPAGEACECGTVIGTIE